ncbi:tetratricopeptide repeat protein [Oceaniradius stylonematis]|jgi:tetratricopeptide (TPR) repeat protein|uniref:tetratricopeptide repeat protein n=1 Tax=Oceaniradius stylonematis TaxID=2184161 RepID=UPI0035CFC0CE
MALSDDCLRSLCTMAIGAGAFALGLSGVTVAAGAMEVMTASGNLALDLRRQQSNQFDKLERQMRRSLEKSYPHWLKTEYGDDWQARADVNAALNQLDDALHRARPTVQDMVAVGHDPNALVITMIEQLPANGLYRTNDTARGVFTAMIVGIHGLARTDETLKPLFDSLSWQRAFDEFAQLKDGQARILDAIHSKTGIPMETLEPIFDAIEEEFPTQDVEAKVREAIQRLIDLAQQPVDVGNLGDDIRNLVESARATLARTADVEQAAAGFQNVYAEADGRMLQASRLAMEEAKMFAAAFRFDEAVRAYHKAARYDPDEAWPWFYIGDIRMHRGNLAAAKTEYEKGIAVAEKAGDRRNVAAGNDRAGHLATQAGNLEQARRAFEAALSIAKERSDAAPNDDARMRDLTVSHNKLGNVAVAQGDLGAARAAYQAGLAIREELARRDPDNVGWQRDLSISYERLGDVARAQDDLGAARSAYQAGLAIAEDLARRDPDNVGWQRDLSISHERLGDVAVARGDLGAARSAYEAGLAIREELAKRDPDNAGWQRDLSVSHEKLGDVAVAQGDLGAARAAYEVGLAIREELAKRDPDNAGWQRDLSVSHNKLGDVAVAQGDLDAARAAYEVGLAIREELARRDPDNAGWQRDLIVSNIKLAEAGDAPAERYAEAQRIARALGDAGRLAPRDAWVIEDLERRLAEAQSSAG